MAWRIDEQVVRGEIDNRTRDKVTGRIWLVNRAEPLELSLDGNPWRDLAGLRLEFINPQPAANDELLRGLHSNQEGCVGDITASRKTKVPDIPMSEIGDYYKTGKKFPWHWGNVLYLEWFSLGNGRVVIESASFELKLSPLASTWQMSELEEQTQRTANNERLQNFIKQFENEHGLE
jgi:hypothetical protein